MELGPPLRGILQLHQIGLVEYTYGMNLITSVPKFSNGEVDKALMRELTLGLELKKQWERRREIEAAHEAKQLANHKEVKGLGRCVAVMPEWEFFRMQQKYGHAEVHSKDFIKYFQKHYPHLSPHKV